MDRSVQSSYAKYGDLSFEEKGLFASARSTSLTEEFGRQPLENDQWQSVFTDFGRSNMVAYSESFSGRARREAEDDAAKAAALSNRLQRLFLLKSNPFLQQTRFVVTTAFMKDMEKNVEEAEAQTGLDTKDPEVQAALDARIEAEGITPEDLGITAEGQTISAEQATANLRRRTGMFEKGEDCKHHHHSREHHLESLREGRNISPEMSSMIAVRVLERSARVDVEPAQRPAVTAAPALEM